MMTGIGVHHRSEWVFTLARNDRSRWAGIRMCATGASLRRVPRPRSLEKWLLMLENGVFWLGRHEARR